MNQPQSIRKSILLAKDFRGFEPTSKWVRSIYPGKLEPQQDLARVPLGVYEECKLTFLTDIERCIATHSIPPQLVLNADQTPSSYVSVGKMTMAARSSSSVPIKGLTDKRNITLTYLLKRRFPTHANNLPRKDESNCQPRGFDFPRGFAVTQNPQHYSSKLETLSLLANIQPYVALKRKELNLPAHRTHC